MKYAVAYIDHLNQDLKLTIVEADNPITAMIEGVREMMEASDRDPWLDDFLKPVSPADYATRIEEIKEAFFDTDQAVEVMPIEKCSAEGCGKRKPGVPSRQQMHEILKARSLQLQSGEENRNDTINKQSK